MRVIIATVFAFVVGSLVTVGCESQKSSSTSSNNASEAIAHANNLKTDEEKKGYLAAESEGLSTAGKYDEAIKVCQHLLSDVDGNFQKAKDILAKAQADMAAGEAAEDAKGALDNAAEGLGDIGTKK